MIHDIVHDIQQLKDQLQQTGRIRRSIDINNFIDPIEKAVTDKTEEIVEYIAAQFSPERDAESDEEDIELQPKIKISEALAALQQLRVFDNEEQQNDGDSSVLSLLNKYEQQIQDRRMESQQMPRTAFLMLVYNVKKSGCSDICCTTYNNILSAQRHNCYNQGLLYLKY